MRNGYIERHFDYVLGPNQDSRLTSVAAGATLELALRLDVDGPFILRSRALRRSWSTDNLDQSGLTGVKARWYGPDRNQTSETYIRQSLLAPYFGQVGNPIPQHPEMFYPAGGEIRLDIQNTGSSAIPNLTFYFRGVKLFKPGAVKAYGYPEKCALLPFAYPVTIPSLPATEPGKLVVFVCKTDADFVFQGMQAGFSFHEDPGQFLALEVGCILEDEDEKPYSNDFVNFDILAGCGHWDLNDFVNPQNIFAGGPAMPGLLFPEIYIPKNHNFYFKVNRADQPYATDFSIKTMDYPVNLIGWKVFEK